MALIVPDAKRQPRATRNAQGPPKQRANRHDFLDYWWPFWGRAQLLPHYQPVRLIVCAAAVMKIIVFQARLILPPLDHILVSSLVTLFREVKCPDPIHHASSPFHSVVPDRSPRQRCTVYGPRQTYFFPRAASR